MRDVVLIGCVFGWCGRVKEWVKAYAKREEKVKNLGVKKIILTNNNDIRKNPFYFFIKTY